MAVQRGTFFLRGDGGEFVVGWVAEMELLVAVHNVYALIFAFFHRVIIIGIVATSFRLEPPLVVVVHDHARHKGFQHPGAGIHEG